MATQKLLRQDSVRPEGHLRHQRTHGRPIRSATEPKYVCSNVASGVRYSMPQNRGRLPKACQMLNLSSSKYVSQGESANLLAQQYFEQRTS